DIGSGTGIFSKQLLDLGAKVYGIEPNDDMRNMAEHLLKDQPNFHSINANAEQTSLPDQSVDFVSAAQAFHWFDKDKFKRECHRILKPEGKIILIWNAEVFGSDLFKDFGAIQAVYSPNQNPNTENNKYDPEEAFFREADAFFKKFENKTFPNDALLDKETMTLRALSSSASPRPDNPKYEEYLNELEKLFNKHQKDGKVVYPSQTKLYIGTI
ncbi:MAG: class I SAM-dependent methyltransferase, partial [Lactobacillus sp.]|nr:class I SAM-dependent methyltransferase [Lactobacillus sp.]